MNRKKHTILTADAEMRLVWRESIAAFSRMGHTVAVREEITEHTIAKTFALPAAKSGLANHPSLLFSVNFNGLDKYGDIHKECKRNALPVAVWLVDTPWNILSGLRDDFWKEVFLFVTDPSFIPGLKEHGAKNVRFLPLATDPAIFADAAIADLPAAPVAFVGRSAFPDKSRFFMGQSVPKSLLESALEGLKDGKRPDFFWWREKLSLKDAALWPGSAARRVSLGAEESSLAWRSACLEAAATAGLTVYGDSGWKDLLPQGSELMPPVDYYVDLAEIYARAHFSLVTTSFLLPHAVNQRHFDIWAAGGFALLDNTPGLDIFPKELANPVTFTKPEEIPDIVKRFTNDPEEKKRLAVKWRETVLAEHTYDIRMRDLLKTALS